MGFLRSCESGRGFWREMASRTPKMIMIICTPNDEHVLHSVTVDTTGGHAAHSLYPYIRIERVFVRHPDAERVATSRGVPPRTGVWRAGPSTTLGMTARMGAQGELLRPRWLCSP